VVGDLCGPMEMVVKDVVNDETFQVLRKHKATSENEDTCGHCGSSIPRNERDRTKVGDTLPGGTVIF
jgi:hypothetical protein